MKEKLGRLWRWITRVSDKIAARFDETHLTVYAAQATYYVIFSMVPFLMLIVMAAKGLFPQQIDFLLDEAKNLLPELTDRIPDAFWDTVLSVGAPALSIAIVTLLWSASKGMKAISMGLCSVFGTKNSKYLWMRYALSVLYTLVLILLLIFALTLLVFGQTLSALLVDKFPHLAPVLDLLMQLRAIIAMVAFSGVILLLYKYTAARKWRFRDLLPGAIFAGAGWVLFSHAFSLYIKYFSSYTTLYGAIGILMILMVWIHACVTILLYGAELDVFLSKNKPRVVA